MSRLAMFACAVAALALGVAAGPSRNAAPEVHDMLAAEQAGLVSVRYIPNDSRSAQIVVTNRSDRPLTLRLPEAFAGVPVLAQFGGGMAGPMGAQGMNVGGFAGANTPQAAAGAGVPNGGPGLGAAGGFQSLPPERTRSVRVPTVCLEYGKPEPTPRVAYQMVPLASRAGDPRLTMVLQGLASGDLSQKVAQAATWHIASGLTWDQLAAETIKHSGGDRDVAFFTEEELEAARIVVEIATRRQSETQPTVINAGESAVSPSGAGNS
jgi:hypothetical protein